MMIALAGWGGRLRLGQVLVMLRGCAHSRPAGKVSVMPMPVSTSGLPAGLVKVSVRVLATFRATLLGVKVCVTSGGAVGTTVRVAVAVPPLPPSVEVTAPVVLTLAPAVIARTCTLTAQAAPGLAMLPSERL